LAEKAGVFEKNYTLAPETKKKKEIIEQFCSIMIFG